MAATTVCKPCHSTTWCGIASCFSQVHVPLPQHAVDVYSTRSGNVYHLDPQCPKARGAATNRDRRRFIDVRAQLCNSCGTTPAWYTQWRTDGTTLGRIARTVIGHACATPNSLAPAEIRRLRRAAATLAAREWSAPLDAAARELTGTAEQVLQRQDPQWLPEPLPAWTVRAAAALLLASNTHPAANLGARPSMDEDIAASGLFPATYLNTKWVAWRDQTAAGKTATTPRPAELFPGRQHVLTRLHQAWDRLADTLAAQPGPDHLVAVPDRYVPEVAAAKPLTAMLATPVRTVTVKGTAYILVIAASLLVETLARLHPIGPADLGELPSGGRAQLLEIAFGIWDEATLTGLRECVLSAPALTA